ncbi:MAG: hypothetical protein J6T48_00805 [Bacteroidales bacterium]|nr:hypothetical protein [Bacteroidales bacterium]
MIEQLSTQACYLHISIPYDKENDLITFDNGIMTELEIDDDFTPPMLNKEILRLEFMIDLKNGKMQDWNEEYGYLRMWAKVRDSGTYTLLDTEKNPICQINGYVPNKLIPPFEKGYGDYIELDINADGTINNWSQNPDLSDFVEEGKSPKPIKTNKWHRAEKALLHIRYMKLNKEEIEWLVRELENIQTN